MTERNEQWREELRKTMSPKERVAIPRAAMNELDATYRSHMRDDFFCFLPFTETLSNVLVYMLEIKRQKHKYFCYKF